MLERCYRLASDELPLFVLGEASQGSSDKNSDVDTHIDMPNEVSLCVPDIDEGIDDEVKQASRKFFKLFHDTVSK